MPETNASNERIVVLIRAIGVITTQQCRIRNRYRVSRSCAVTCFEGLACLPFEPPSLIRLACNQVLQVALITMCYVYIVIVAFGDNDIGQVDGTTIQVHSCT